MKKRHILGIAIALLFAFTSSSYAESFMLDKDHSQIGFRVKHLVISNVTGEFLKYEGTFEADKDGKVKAIHVKIDASSIYTKHEKRDKHLKSPDFLDAAKFPDITFDYKKTLSKEGQAYRILGDLTIRGIKREVVLSVTVLGTVKDPWGNFRVGFTGKTEINRKDFGMVWNKMLDSGGMIVGDIVHINLEGEGILVKAKQG